MQPYKVWLFSDLIEKNKRVFKVPVYQRNYDWSNIQCEKLYQDIMIANQRDHKHFTGTIVYIVGLNASTLSEVLIIDGQQRLTTMYILLKALYDAAKGVSIRIESEIEEVMFNRNCDEKYKLKLKPVKTDNEQLLLLVKDKIDEMDRNSNIYKNYITFKNLIEKTVASGLDLFDILNGIKKLEMVEIVLDKSQGDEPQKIFESINSTGLELSLSDLLRNYLLMDDSNQDELYENYWSVIEKNVGYRNLGDFVINYLNSQISGSVNSKNAYRLFKEHCESKNLTHEDVLKDLLRTSKYYGAFIGEKQYYNKEITDYLRSFYTIKQTTVLPFVFKVFNDYEENNIDEKTLCNVLEYLLTYFIRITSCEINKNLSINKTGIFFESNLSSNNIISFIRDLLSRMDLDADEFSFSLSEAPFDINDENTWLEGMLPVAKLFYNLIEDLIKNAKINATEIEKLKTKEYTKSIFKATDYPAIANNVDDNKGNSNYKRYRAKELRFNNADIYISTQFFESDREAVIEWYKSH